jgi:hypothetical protein
MDPTAARLKPACLWPIEFLLGFLCPLLLTTINHAATLKAFDHELCHSLATPRTTPLIMPQH